MVLSVKVRVRASDFLRGVDLLRDSFPEARKSILKEAAGEAAKLVETTTSPRRTGNLASSGRVVEDNNKISLVVGGIMGKGNPPREVDYAKFVEVGTSLQPPQFFTRRAVVIALSDLDSLSHSILQSWLDELKSA